jgi:hypothetical protein
MADFVFKHPALSWKLKLLTCFSPTWAGKNNNDPVPIVTAGVTQPLTSIIFISYHMWRHLSSFFCRLPAAASLRRKFDCFRKLFKMFWPKRSSDCLLLEVRCYMGADFTLEHRSKIYKEQLLKERSNLNRLNWSFSYSLLSLTLKKLCSLSALFHMLLSFNSDYFVKLHWPAGPHLV